MFYQAFCGFWFYSNGKVYMEKQLFFSLNFEPKYFLFSPFVCPFFTIEVTYWLGAQCHLIRKNNAQRSSLLLNSKKPCHLPTNSFTTNNITICFCESWEIATGKVSMLIDLCSTQYCSRQTPFLFFLQRKTQFYTKITFLCSFNW